MKHLLKKAKRWSPRAKPLYPEPFPIVLNVLLPPARGPKGDNLLAKCSLPLVSPFFFLPLFLRATSGPSVPPSQSLPFHWTPTHTPKA